MVNAGCREKDLDHVGKHLKAFQVRGASRISYDTSLLLAAILYMYV